MPATAQGQAGTSRDKARTSKDKTGTFPFCACLCLLVPTCPCMSMLVPVCPCLSLSVLVCPCMSLSVLVCPCLSLYVSVDEYNSRHQYEYSYILAKTTVPMHANLILNFFFTFVFLTFIQSEQFYSSDKYHKGIHLVSFNYFLFQCKLMKQVTFILNSSHEY